MRRNLIPGLALQILALTIVVLYVSWQPFGVWLVRVGQLKTDLGYVFSGLSTALFGGLLPFLFLWVKGELERTRRGSVLLFYLGFWLWKGMEVDALYRGQALLFGDIASVAVIVRKTLIDQFVYCPLWAIPTQVLCFLWKDADFSWARLKSDLAVISLGRRVAIVAVSSWVVWIPTVAIVYALPVALQIPLFNLIVCFWSLLMTSLSQSKSLATHSEGEA